MFGISLKPNLPRCLITIKIAYLLTTDKTSLSKILSIVQRIYHLETVHTEAIYRKWHARTDIWKLNGGDKKGSHRRDTSYATCRSDIA